MKTYYGTSISQHDINLGNADECYYDPCAEFCVADAFESIDDFIKDYVSIILDDCVEDYDGSINNECLVVAQKLIARDFEVFEDEDTVSVRVFVD